MDSTGTIDWQTMRSGLVRFLARRTGCNAVAEDLAQDLWCRLQSSPAALTGVRNPTGYVFRAAANAAFDWRKRETRGGGIEFDDVSDAHWVDEQPSPERQVQARQAHALLREAVAALPPKCREAFILCRIEGMTMRAAGKRMGVSERTVENHLVRATRECRQKLLDAGAWP